MSENPTIASEVVARFGGLTGTARVLSTPDKPFAISTVQGWVKRGRVPQEHWAALIAASKASEGKELSLADFLPAELVAA